MIRIIQWSSLGENSKLYKVYSFNGQDNTLSQYRRGFDSLIDRNFKIRYYEKYNKYR